MLKKYFVLVLISLLTHTMISVEPVSASAISDEQARFTEKVRLGITRLGVGKEAVVELRLRDKSKLAGYISQTDEDRFLVTDAKTGASVSVAYSDVVKVKGHNLSTGAKIGIGIAVGFIVTALIIYLVANSH